MNAVHKVKDALGSHKSENNESGSPGVPGAFPETPAGEPDRNLDQPQPQPQPTVPTTKHGAAIVPGLGERRISHEGLAGAVDSRVESDLNRHTANETGMETGATRGTGAEARGAMEPSVGDIIEPTGGITSTDKSESGLDSHATREPASNTPSNFLPGQGPTHGAVHLVKPQPAPGGVSSSSHRLTPNVGDTTSPREAALTSSVSESIQSTGIHNGVVGHGSERLGGKDSVLDRGVNDYVNRGSK
ncbi:hypothetical protein F4778DRAFT_715118 [Xylariomycetidae sp. FL2044]|nr:hypothetical protein F4778DRAFT_715118 [Xylariomycetidae sp. FL2044]